MIQEYLEYQKKRRGLADNTLEAYAKDLLSFVGYAKRNGLRWSTLTKQDIDGYLSELDSEGKTAATINRHLSSIRGLLTWANHEGLLTTNAARFCQLKKQEERLPEQAPTEAIERYLAMDAHTERREVIQALLRLLLDTGIRIQEAIDIRRSDFNLDDMSITIHGKGRRERKVYYQQRTIEKMVRIGGRYGDNLLPQWTQRTYRQEIINELRPLGIRTHPHALRHTFATSMLNKGADINVVSFLLGHKSVKTTERYAKVSNVTAMQQYRQFN